MGRRWLGAALVAGGLACEAGDADAELGLPDAPDEAMVCADLRPCQGDCGDTPEAEEVALAFGVAVEARGWADVAFPVRATQSAEGNVTVEYGLARPGFNTRRYIHTKGLANADEKIAETIDGWPEAWLDPSWTPPDERTRHERLADACGGPYAALIDEIDPAASTYDPCLHNTPSLEIVYHEGPCNPDAVGVTFDVVTHAVVSCETMIWDCVGE